MLLVSILATVCAISFAEDFKFTANDKVITSDTGLQYADTKVGRGDEIKASQLAIVNYVLRLGDGSEVDSSLKPGGRPFQFVVGKGQVIKGWDEGLLGMKPGGTRKLKVPSALGYGEQGIEGVIPGGADLWFTIETLAATDTGAFTKSEKVIKSDTGLQFVDLVSGKGDAIKKGEQASVFYTLFSEKGEMLETNRGQRPLPFTLGAPGIIGGFDEGTTGMKVGGIRKIRVPSKLGYGDKGSGPVKPGETLWFVIDLAAIK